MRVLVLLVTANAAHSTRACCARVLIDQAGIRYVKAFHQQLQQLLRRAKVAICGEEGAHKSRIGVDVIGEALD